jgi:glycerol-3-phosphate dehydrogenase
LTRWACTRAWRETGAQASHWHVNLRSAAGEELNVKARALVNATGPWAAQFLTEQLGAAQRKSLRLVKGSHIVLPQLFEHDHAYIFQNPDKRIIFAIPYEGDFTLIGTTDVEHDGAIGAARIDAAETNYLCEQASRYFERAVKPADVVWSYSGVRPLLDDESGDPSAVTRDYSLELDTAQAPLLSVWGGKITTFRKLAEEAADLLAAPLATPHGAWTAGRCLPGGDLGAADKHDSGARGRNDVIGQFERHVHALQLRHPELAPVLCRRLARGYGSRTGALLAGGLGAEVAPGLFEAELNYLYSHEWARCADDVLWRRTKLGLHMTDSRRAAVATWCTTHWGALPVPTPTPANGTKAETSWN